MPCERTLIHGPVNVMNRTTESAIYVMETLVRGGVSMGNDKNQTVGRELIYGSFYRCIGTKKSGRIEKVS